MALSDYQALVGKLVRDESNSLVPADLDQAIELAGLRYSLDCPRELVQDVTWTATGHVGPTPTGWVLGRAFLVEVELPIGQVPRRLADVSVYQLPDDQQLIASEPIQAGQVARVTFTLPHDLTEDTDTVPVEHREALASYAAHLLCKQLATRYSGERETAIGADSASTDSRARNYALRARDYRASYYAGIGRIDPQADKSGATALAGQAPAASIAALPCRGRFGLTRGAAQ